MIIRFALDPFILTSKETNNVDHRRLINLWLLQRIGVLVYTRSDTGNEIRRSITAISDPDISKLWSTSFGQGVKLKLNRPIKFQKYDVSEYTPEVMRFLAPHIDVLVTDTRDHFNYGARVIQTDAVSTIVQFSDNSNSQVELIDLKSFDYSKEVQKVIRLRGNGVLSPKESVDNIWQERFARLFHVSKDISIVDRYICVRHDRYGNSSGLSRLIELAKKHSPDLRNKEITIYAELPNSDTIGSRRAIEQMVSIIQETVNNLQATPSPIAKLTIQFIPESSFSRLARDRHIRFARIGSVAGGHGSEVLEGRNYKIEDFKGISWNSDIDACAELENRLKDHGDPREPIVVIP